MKLDWDVVREILLALENSNTPRSAVRNTDFPKLDDQIVGYHMGLLSDAGLLELFGSGVRYSSSGDGRILIAIAERLTMEGHKLLDTLRSDTVWGKVTEHFKAAGVAMTLSSVGKVAETITASLLGSAP